MLVDPRELKCVQKSFGLLWEKVEGKGGRIAREKVEGGRKEVEGGGGKSNVLKCVQSAL